MKKYFIISLLFFSVLAFGQRKVIYDSLDVSTITGSDTTICFGKMDLYFGTPLSVEIEYGGLGGDDGTLTLGASNDTIATWSFNSLSTTSFPFTLDATTNGYTNNAGNTVATEIFVIEHWLHRRLCYKVDPPTTATGKIYFKVRQK